MSHHGVQCGIKIEKKKKTVKKKVADLKKLSKEIKQYLKVISLRNGYKPSKYLTNKFGP